MGLIRPICNGRFEVYNEKAAFLGGEWVEIKNETATKLMQNGYDLTLEGRDITRISQFILDRDKMLLILSMQSKIMLYDKDILIIENNDYGINLRGSIVSSTDTCVKTDILITILMKYLLIYSSIGHKAWIRHSIAYGTNIRSTYMIEGRKVFMKMKANRTLDEIKSVWDEQLEKGLLMVESYVSNNENTETYIDIGVEKVREILNRIGIA